MVAKVVGFSSIRSSFVKNDHGIEGVYKKRQDAPMLKFTTIMCLETSWSTYCCHGQEYAKDVLTRDVPDSFKAKYFHQHSFMYSFDNLFVY